LLRKDFGESLPSDVWLPACHLSSLSHVFPVERTFIRREVGVRVLIGSVVETPEVVESFLVSVLSGVTGVVTAFDLSEPRVNLTGWSHCDAVSDYREAG